MSAHILRVLGALLVLANGRILCAELDKQQHNQPRQESAPTTPAILQATSPTPPPPPITTTSTSASGHATPSTPSSVNLPLLENDSNKDLLDYSVEMLKELDFREGPANEGPTKALLTKHHTHDELQDVLMDLARKNPQLVRLYSIGESVEARKLWVLEIAEQPGEHVRLRPEFRYIANMHGNEVVGRELVLALARLLVDNYNFKELNNQTSSSQAEIDKPTGSKFIKKLIKNTRIHLMPTMNPDGHARATVACKYEEPSQRGRLNANNVNLNRNFPDRVLKTQVNAGTQPEVRAVMDWSLREPFVLSANLHGGSLVASIPYDGSLNTSAVGSAERRSPDHDVFFNLARAYSQSHPTMSLGLMCYDKCTDYHPETFPEFGVTTGSGWYSIYGSLQDWAYENTNEYQITLELGCNQYPPAEALKDYWQFNKAPLLNFMRQVHKGIKGTVQDARTDAYLANVTVHVRSNGRNTTSTAYGDYFRLLSPGNHVVVFDHPQYEPVEIDVFIQDTMAQIHRIKLQPRGGSPSSGEAQQSQEAQKPAGDDEHASTPQDHSLVVATLVFSALTLGLLLSLVGAYFIQKQRYIRSQSVSVEMQPTSTSRSTGTSLAATQTPPKQPGGAHHLSTSGSTISTNISA